MYNRLIHVLTRNAVKDVTCLQKLVKPRSIYLILTNSASNFQSIATLSHGLSDFHRTTVNGASRVMFYRDYETSISPYSITITLFFYIKTIL